ncbi:MAG: AAA family ATPase [Planctomycetota bacterium]
MSPPAAPTNADSLLPGALLDPAAYPEPPPSVELIETHISWIYLAGDRAYKVKKPVRLAFLDFSSLAARRHFLEEELRLNAVLAPGVCRAVVPIVRDGARLGIGGPGVPFEYALEMRRLPAHRMLDRLLEQGVVDNAMMNALADTLCRFHAQAAVMPAEQGAPEQVASAVTRNLHDLAAGRTDLAPLIAPLERYATQFVRTHHDLFLQRALQGRVRDGHGDLHAGNICFEDGAIVIYDRIEFEPRFRQMDVAADLAFLAMDLDHRGCHAFSDFLVHQYVQRSGDATLPLVLPFYKAHRAAIRAKVAALRFDQQASAAELASLRAHLNLALSYTLAGKPLVVMMCGLPGSGKTVVARALQATLRAQLVRTDVVRRSLEAEPSYGELAVTRAYDALLAAARGMLDRGLAVILDATFDRRVLRERARAMAAAVGAPCVTVLVECAEPIIKERLERRAREGGDASEAGWSVYLRKKSSFEEPRPDLESSIRHQSGLPIEPLVTSVLARIIEILAYQERGMPPLPRW